MDDPGQQRLPLDENPSEMTATNRITPTTSHQSYRMDLTSIYCLTSAHT
jgi:hypothetical protein